LHKQQVKSKASGREFSCEQTWSMESRKDTSFGKEKRFGL
jgi:hypothetical protein